MRMQTNLTPEQFSDWIRFMRTCPYGLSRGDLWSDDGQRCCALGALEEVLGIPHGDTGDGEDVEYEALREALDVPTLAPIWAISDVTAGKVGLGRGPTNDAEAWNQIADLIEAKYAPREEDE